MLYWKTRSSLIWLAIMLVVSSLLVAIYEDSWMAGARQFITFVLIVACIELLMNLLVLFFAPPEPKEKK